MNRDLTFQILTEQDLNRFGMVQGYYLFRMEIFNPDSVGQVKIEIKMFLRCDGAFKTMGNMFHA